MIGCAFVEYLSVLRAPSQTPFESFPTPWSPFADSSLTPLKDTLAPLVEVFSPFPTFCGFLLSLLQPLSGPSGSFVPLRGYLFLGFLDNPQLFQARRAPAPHDGAHHSEEKQPIVHEDEPPVNTNRHKDRRTSFNDKRRPNASAILCPWYHDVMGACPPGSAGVPPAQILSQLRPSPPPESTGSGALPLPGPCGSRRQGGRLQHRRETERQPKGQHAGGTPALPGVSSRW